MITRFSVSRPRAVIFAALLLAGCAGPQSALDPAGPAAATLDRLGITMSIAAALVTILVTALMLVPILSRRERRVNRRLFLWGGGVALPLITLTALVPYVFAVGSGLRTSEASGISVVVTGHQFWWEMSYSQTDGARGVVTANELRLPVGEPVELFLRSEDVIHSFWAPKLAGKTDLIPGRVNRMVIEADRPGVYRGQCAEFCGAQHAHMAFDVIALPRAEFDAWLATLAAPAPQPSTPQLSRGRDLFIELGCGSCHTIRGVSRGSIGPDLTLVGARRSIGGGILEGGVGNIAVWISSAQSLKPGITMPSYDQLDGAELMALATYLGSLK